MGRSLAERSSEIRQQDVLRPPLKHGDAERDGHLAKILPGKRQEAQKISRGHPYGQAIKIKQN